MPLLILGARTPAVEAANRVSGAPWVLSETKPRRATKASMAGHALVEFDEEGAVETAARRLLGDARPDAVVATNERGVVPAARLRRALGVPGASVETAIACHDKHVMKARARQHGIATAGSEVVAENATAEALVGALGLPMVIKPVDSSGSRATSVARSIDEVRAAMAPGLQAESFVSGVEMSVEGLVSGGQLRFRNPTEYSEPLWASIAPAPVDTETRDAVYGLLDEVVAAFAIERGIVHMEVFLTDAGPVLGELALRPPGGHLMDVLAEAYGFDPWEAFLACERGEVPQAPTFAERSAGARLLHYGVGVVESVTGVEAARALPGVVRLPLSLEPGSVSKARIGSGVESGYVLATGADRDAVWTTLEGARNAIQVRMRTA